MAFVEYLVSGGIIAVLSLVFVIKKYYDNLKEQVIKDTKEKSRINENLKELGVLLENFGRDLKKLTDKYDKGIIDYYELTRDVALLEQNFKSLVRRYNREHDSHDFRPYKKNKKIRRGEDDE